MTKADAPLPPATTAPAPGPAPATADVPPPPMPAALQSVADAAAAAAAALAPATDADAAQPQPAKAAAATELDLAFCCDCTGSMGSYIRAAQDNIRAIAQSIHDQRGGTCSIRYALVKYRDHPPQDRSFITEVFPFTKNIEVMKRGIDTMSASGGGDGPEAVSAALQEVNELEWRANATKVCVFIADAPPHGLGERGDGFPEGCPQGHDPVKLCKALAAKGVTVYSIGVEPILSQNYKFARDFMIMMAKITDGQFLPLGKAGILAEVIVNSAIEGMQLAGMWEQLEQEVAAEAAAANERLNDDALVNRVEERMTASKAQNHTKHITVENPYMDDGYDMANVERMMAADSLGTGRRGLDTARNAHVAGVSAGYQWQQQAMHVTEASMSESQVSRCAGRGRKMKGVHSY